MHFRITLRKQTYGGHTFYDYKLKVSYDRNKAIIGRSISVDLAGESDLVTKVTDVLLNQSCPAEIAAQGDSILYPGDVISRLHVRTIIDHWEDISLANTPWEALKTQVDGELVTRLRKLNIEEGSLPVLVEFSFDSPLQQSGSFSISTKVARWLGTQLLALADGNASANAREIEVREETYITETPVLN